MSNNRLVLLAIVLGCVLSAFPLPLGAQSFTVEPLVQIPGDNSQFTANLASVEQIFMSWVNHNDSLYTLYVQQIEPTLGAAATIQSTTNPLSSPSITQHLLVWAEQSNGYWRLNMCSYENGSWTTPETLVDSLEGPVEISASDCHVAWTSAGKLYVMALQTCTSDTVHLTPTLVDSGYCRHPALNGQWENYIQIAYEKDTANVSVIRYWSWSSHFNSSSYHALSENGINRNPRFGPNYTLSYETYQDSCWKIVYYMYLNDERGVTTDNFVVNYHNPVLFAFDIPTRDTIGNDWLLVFDADSLSGNREIYCRVVPPYQTPQAMIDISNATGVDSLPVVCFFGEYSESPTFSDGTVLIFWTHIDGNDSQIWWAQAPYELSYFGAVDQASTTPGTFKLYSNYPNPFNPSTHIRYSLSVRAKVSLSIWNVDGELVERLLQGYQSPGEHIVNWEPRNLSAGVYFYTLQVGNRTQTRKCVFLK